MLKRDKYLNQVKNAFKINPVVAILGPRQCGKTTLARFFLKESKYHTTIFDLEDPVDATQLENPKIALSQLKGLVIIDEIQRMPNLFTMIRVLVDRPQNKTKFLILGSASKELIKQSSESLAGRISYIELTPFSCFEVDDFNKLWFVGGFPKSFLSKNYEDSYEWRKPYISTYLEQDIPNLGIKIPPNSLRRFWTMLAHYHGSIINYSELANSLQISSPTIRRYIDILTGTFMIRQLQPWFENLKKRQVKSPKIYFRDTGILHSLLGIKQPDQLQVNPKLGYSWEGFAIEQIIRNLNVSNEEIYFWATHNKAELDLLVFKDGNKYGFEFKYSDAPKITPSMKIALDYLKLDTLTVIYPEGKTYYLHEKIKVISLFDFIKN